MKETLYIIEYAGERIVARPEYDGNWTPFGCDYPAINNWGPDDDRLAVEIIAVIDLDNLTITPITTLVQS